MRVKKRAADHSALRPSRARASFRGMDEIELEVFRAGGTASRGITAERLASLESFDCEANPVGCVIGHPKNDTPAEGRIKGFRLDGNKLFAKIAGLSKRVVDGVRKGDLLNRSMAFFDEDHEANPTPGKLAPRHLGFLGAAAPGIPGMQPLTKALAFAADDSDELIADGDPAEAVIFAAEPTPALTVFEAKETAPMADTPAPVAPTAEELTQRETAFAARVRSQFEASNTRTLDSLVAEGKVLPAEVEGLKLAFNAFDPEADELTFGAGDKATKATAVSHIFAFMASALPKRVPVDGGRQSPTAEFTADDKPKSAAEVTAAAEALVAGRPGLTFEAAVAEVTGEK